MNNVFNRVQILPVFKLVKILSLVAFLLMVTISESRAAPAGCIGAQNLGPGWKCDSCEDGYELYENFWFQSCRKSTLNCNSNQDAMYGTCSPKCDSGGNRCPILNCCYKTEGDTTTIYSSDPTQALGYLNDNLSLPDNKNLIVEPGVTRVDVTLLGSFESVYLPDNAQIYTRGCIPISSPVHIIVSGNGAEETFAELKRCNSKQYDVICLEDVEKCKQAIGEQYAYLVSPATESQCNTSGSYYFTGSSCEKRPTDGTDITCEHEISGYVKVGNYCVSPENSYAKKHYTPAEAAQWLKDDNTNEVTITFKK